MSEWTHILGVIRFDSWSKNVTPRPVRARDNVEFESSTIYSAFDSNRPTGSEGPLEVNVIETSKGPTLLITGDLRDFGRDNMPDIIEWLNESYDLVRRVFDNTSMFTSLTILQDAIVYLYTEDEREDYYVRFDYS